MTKLLLSLSFTSLMILITGTALFPDISLFWLATSGESYQYMREALAAVVLLQLMTRPPRHAIFRVITGFVAVGVGGWALGATYNNSLLFLDSMSFLAASFAIGITALELEPSARPERYHASSGIKSS